MRFLTLLGLSLTSTNAFAASDLIVDWTGSNIVTVDTNATWNVRVRNIGNRDASNVELRIQLPTTNTSPTEHVMGALGAAPGCSLVGTELVCNLGTLRRSRSVTKSFDLALPWTDAPPAFSASASTTSSENTLANNSAPQVADVLFLDLPVDAPALATVQTCTGRGLTAFYECRLYPSSISSFTAEFLPGGGMTFPGQDPGYGGFWWQTTDSELAFDVTYFGDVVATFGGDGVDGVSCFEGITSFPTGDYNAAYEVCF